MEQTRKETRVKLKTLGPLAKPDVLNAVSTEHPYADTESCIYALLLLNITHVISPNEIDECRVGLTDALKVWDMISPVTTDYFTNWKIPGYSYMLQCMKHLGKPLPTENDIHYYRQKCQLLDIDSEMVSELINEGLIITDAKYNTKYTKPLEIECCVFVFGGKALHVTRTFSNLSTALKESDDDYKELLNCYISYYTADGVSIQKEYASNMYNLAMKHLINLGVDIMDYLAIYQKILSMKQNEYDFIERVVKDCLILLYHIKNQVIAMLANK